MKLFLANIAVVAGGAALIANQMLVAGVVFTIVGIAILTHAVENRND